MGVPPGDGDGDGDGQSAVVVQVATPGRRDWIDAAARIWAAATSARDGEREVAPLSESRPLIEAALAPAGSLLIVAARAGRALAFAAVQPMQAQRSATAEVRYLGVDPTVWGEGVGTQLLRALPGLLRATGFTHARLSVYEDNKRALALYEKAGWRALPERTVHPRSGRLERHYALDC